MEETEYELQQKLKKLRDTEKQAILEEQQRDLTKLLKMIPTPKARAMLLGRSIHLIPEEIDETILRTIVEGYIALRMFREAGAVEAYHLKHYEKGIELLLVGAKEDPKRAGQYAEEAAYIAEDYLKNEDRARSLMIEAGSENAIKYFTRKNDPITALRIAEENGLFFLARSIARDIGDEEKSRLYDVAFRLDK